MSTNPHQPRKQSGSPDGGQFAAKEHADATANPLGAATKGTASLGTLYFGPGGDEPRTPLEQEMVRAERVAERAKARAEQLHMAATAHRVSEAFPDISSLEIEVDEGSETLVVSSIRDASGQEIDDNGAIAQQLDHFLAGQDDFMAQWKDNADHAAVSLIGGPATVNIAEEVDKAPVIPEPGTRAASVARAEDTLAAYGAPEDNGEDQMTAAQDLVTDLFHLCEQNGWDFDQIVASAARNGHDESSEWDAVAGS